MNQYKIRYYIKTYSAIIQFILLIISECIISVLFYLFRNFYLKSKKRKFVIGTREVSKNIYYLGKVLEDSYTVNLYRHSFYKPKHIKYDFGPYNLIIRILVSPFLLAYLANICDIFIYIFSDGFLLDRRYDFIYLKWKRKKIVTIFLGNDIRSIKKCKEKFSSLGIDTFCNYYSWINPIVETDSEFYEKMKKKIANIAEKYANVIFNCEADQPSYIFNKKKVYGLRMPIDTNEFWFNEGKLNNMDKIVILHAPSSPIIKGTQLVRAVIKKLETEGYVFDYYELLGIDNEEIKRTLHKSHIVLNQFYATTPGMFGLEALSTGNAVLMSADPNLNPDIPEEAKDSWIITHYWEIYDKLKMLLDNPDLIKKYAYNGREYVVRYHSIEAVRRYLLDIFKKEGVLI